jgi:hypothetical protein
MSNLTAEQLKEISLRYPKVKPLLAIALAGSIKPEDVKEVQSAAVQLQLRRAIADLPDDDAVTVKLRKILAKTGTLLGRPMTCLEPTNASVEQGMWKAKKFLDDAVSAHQAEPTIQNKEFVDGAYTAYTLAQGIHWVRNNNELFTKNATSMWIGDLMLRLLMLYEPRRVAITKADVPSMLHIYEKVVFPTTPDIIKQAYNAVMAGNEKRLK